MGARKKRDDSVWVGRRKGWAWVEVWKFAMKMVAGEGCVWKEVD